MPIYDYECPVCDDTFERIGAMSTAAGAPCPKCGSYSRRVYVAGGTNTVNDDSPWVRSIAECADPDNKSDHVQAFIRNPTRSTYKAWMKGEGLRHKEPGERPDRSGLDHGRHADLILRAKQERDKITIGR